MSTHNIRNSVLRGGRNAGDFYEVVSPRPSEALEAIAPS